MSDHVCKQLKHPSLSAHRSCLSSFLALMFNRLITFLFLSLVVPSQTLPLHNILPPDFSALRFRGLSANQPSSRPSSSYKDIGPLARQSTACTMRHSSPSTRKVLQTNGTADDLITFLVCPTSTLFTQQYEYFSSSSSEEVLQSSSSDLALQIFASPPCSNVTVLFVFDDMVGRTTYTLSARLRGSNEVLCSASIDFIVAGLTVFEDTVALTSTNTTGPQLQSTDRRFVTSDADPNTIRIIYSGTDNGVVTNYRNALSSARRDLNVKIQFPDGIDSSSRSKEFLKSAMQGLDTSASTDATSPLSFENNVCNQIQEDVSSFLSSSSSCGAAFGVDNSIIFALRYDPYRDGEVDFGLTWSSFTSSDSDLLDEEYMNVLKVSVNGDAPPLVESISFPNVIYRAGGQEVTVVFDNSEGSTSRFLKVGDYQFPEIEGTYRRLENGLYEAKYFTSIGNGTDLTWELVTDFDNSTRSVSTFVNNSIPRTVSYVTQLLELGKVEPPYGSGEQTIVLEGFFDGFNPTRAGHEIFIGEKRISDLDIVPIVSENKTRIILTIPPRDDAGNAYNYDIRVVINEETTNGKLYAYAPTDLFIDIVVVGGTKGASEREYILGSCETSTYLVSPPSGVAPPELCDWKVTDRSSPSRGNVLSEFPSILANGSSLVLAANIFGSNTGAFSVYANCTIYPYGINLETEVIVRKNSAPGIGVILQEPSSRSLKLPQGPAHVIAELTFPTEDCFLFQTEVIYEWTYDGLTYSMSQTNDTKMTFGAVIRPARLGRELIIPQSKLKYGNFSVDLFVYVDGDSAVRGNATTTLVVQPPELIPIIGYGALKLSQSSNFDLRITSERSFNPDYPQLPGNGISSVEWTCLFSTNEKNISTPCDERLLPSQQSPTFVIPSSALQSVREQLRSSRSPTTFYLRYFLLVRANVSTVTSSTFQTISVIESSNPLAFLSSINVRSTQNESFIWAKIPFYEDIVIEPFGVNVSWIYSTRSPKSQQGLFQSEKGLYVLPGYYTPSKTTLKDGLPVALQANTLLPAYSYTIVLTLESLVPNVLDSNVTIVLQTVDRPKLVLPPLPTREGSISTFFAAAARVNLDSNNDFLFFFYLVSLEGEYVCLDGCTGASVIQFQVFSAGIYWILVRLRSVFSSRILDEQYFARNISVVEDSAGSQGVGAGTSKDLELLDRAVRLGDDGSVDIISAFAIRNMRASERQASYIESTRFLARTLEIVNKTLFNSQPTTMLAQKFIDTASQLSRVDLNLTSSTYFAYLYSIVESTISRVPLGVPLDVESSVLSFFNYTTSTVIRRWSKASNTSNGLIASDALEEARVLLMEHYTYMERQLSLVLSRTGLCGSTRRVDTLLVDSIPPLAVGNVLNISTVVRQRREESFSMINSYGLYGIPEHSTFTITTVCSERHLQIMFGSTAYLGWCKEAYIGVGIQSDDEEKWELKDGRRVVLTMLESVDYPWMANLVGERFKTDTSSLITTNIKLLLNSTLQSVPSPPTSRCYDVNMSIPRLGRAESKGCLSADGFQLEKVGNASNTSSISSFPLPRYEGVKITKSFRFSRDQSSTVAMGFSTPGIVGAKLANCPQNAFLPIATLPDGPSQFPYMVTASVVAIGLTGTLSWFSMTTVAYGSVASVAT